MKPLDFVALILATWRLSSLLVQERGPFAVLAVIRAQASRHTETAKLFECVWCMSVWVAPLLLVLHWCAKPLIWILALSAGAIALDRWTSGD